MSTIESAGPVQEKPAPRASKGAPVVQVRGDLERALIGAIGALVPVLAVLYTGGLEELGPKIYVNGAIAAVVGALIAWAQPEIRNRFGVVQIGMSVPALLASLVVSGQAARERNLGEALKQQQRASGAANQPTGAVPTARHDHGADDLFGLVAAVHAQDAQDAKGQSRMVKAAPVGVLEYLGLKSRRDWFVITAMYPTEDAAHDAAKKIRTGGKAEVLGVPTSQGVLYAVVIGHDLTFEDATTLRDASIAAGLRSTRVWTTELPPGPITPVCETEEVASMRWKNFGDALGQPAFAYVGKMDRHAATFRVRVIFPDKGFSIAPGPSDEAEANARTGNLPGQWLDFATNGPRETKTISVGDKRFDVQVPKIDFGTATDDDVDVKICRAS